MRKHDIARGLFLFGTILIFPSGRRERSGTSNMGTEDGEQRTKDRERHWCALSIASPPVLKNEGPNQRFICSSLLFLVLYT